MEDTQILSYATSVNFIFYLAFWALLWGFYRELRNISTVFKELQSSLQQNREVENSPATLN